jgi:L-asparagine transporter-like permease
MINSTLDATKTKAAGIMQNLVNNVPNLALWVGFACFLVFGVFEMIYYFSAFNEGLNWFLSVSLCVIVAFIIEAGRVVLLLATMADTSKVSKDKKIAVLIPIAGLLLTVWLVWYQYNSIDLMAQMWANKPNFVRTLKHLLYFLNLFSLLLEIRIAFVLVRM